MVGGDVDGSQPAPGEAALVQDVTQSLRARNMACIVVDENMAEAMRRALAEADTFFTQGTQLNKMAALRSTRGSGYLRVLQGQGQGALLAKEALDGHLNGNYLRPGDSTFQPSDTMDTGHRFPSLEDCRVTFNDAYDIMHAAGRGALAAAAAAAAAAAVGLAPADLASLLEPELARWEHGSSYISAIKYRAPAGPAGGLLGDVLAPEHVDGGLFTLIYTSDTGLQVRDPASGEWVDVEPADYSSGGAVGRVTVLVGAQLERATGGALKASEHRVVVKEATGNPINLPRLALVFRLRAPPNALLDPVALSRKINVPILLLSYPALRMPMSVANFDAAFQQAHPSITYYAVREQEAMMQALRHGEMQITIKTLTLKSITVYADRNDTVEAVMVKVWLGEGIPVDKQRLLLPRGQDSLGFGMRLEPDRTLQEYGIDDGAVLTLVVSLRGD